MCMLEYVSVWEHARRCGVRNPAGSRGGRLGVFYFLILYSRHDSPDMIAQLLLDTRPDFTYTNFSRGRAFAFMYTKRLGSYISRDGRIYY